MGGALVGGCNSSRRRSREIATIRGDRYGRRIPDASPRNAGSVSQASVPSHITIDN